MKKIFVAAGVVGALGFGAFGFASAYSTFTASQTGFHQYGNAHTATLKMDVEAGMADPNDVFLPDSGNCGFGNCNGGTLSFNITNPTDVPIAVRSIAVAPGFCYTQGCTPPPKIFSPLQSCIVHATFAAPGAFLGVGVAGPPSLQQWPVIEPHSTLHVNGSDYGGLGQHMLHLDANTPDECQGQPFTVWLIVTAGDAA
jgi:hypothetical protein